MIQREKYDNEYLEIVPLNKPVNKETYEYKVLSQNVLKHFVKINIREVDNNCEVTFSIQNENTLAYYLQENDLSKEVLRELFKQMFEAIEELDEYMIEPSNLYLDVETIIISEEGALKFLAIPNYNENLALQLQRLTSQLINYVGASNNKAIFKLYKYLLNGECSLEEVNSIINDEVLENRKSIEPEPVKENKEMKIIKEEEIDDIFDNENEEEKQNLIENPLWKNILVGIIGAVAFLLALAFKMLGYFPYISIEKILGGILIIMAIVLGISMVMGSMKNNKKIPNMKKDKNNSEIIKKELNKTKIDLNLDKDKLFNTGNNIKSSYIIKNEQENLVKKPNIFCKKYTIPERKIGENDEKNMMFMKSTYNTCKSREIDDIMCRTYSDSTNECFKTPNSSVDYGVFISQSIDDYADIYFRNQNSVIGSMKDTVDDYVSVGGMERLHCRVFRKDASFYIEKLSRNAKLRVNEVELQHRVPCQLVSYDQVELGDNLYIFLIVREGV